MAINRPFPVSPVLTAITISYRNDAKKLIADKVLPRVPVAASKFAWTYHPVAQGITFPDTEVGRRGRVERVEFSGEQKTEETRDYGLEDAIPQTDIDDAASMRNRGLGTYDPLTTATELLTDLILTDREVRVAALIQNPVNYPAKQRRVLAGGDKFSDYVNSDPLQVFKDAFNSTLIFRPNTAVMSREMWSVVSSHPHLVNACVGNVTGRGIISPEQFVRLFSGEGLWQVLIGEGSVNVARRGQAPVIQKVWGNSISLLYIDPAARPENGLTFGMTAQYGTRLGSTWEDRNVGIEGGTVVRVGERVREVITAPDVGYIIQNAL